MPSLLEVVHDEISDVLIVFDDKDARHIDERLSPLEDD
jgi:hypothetical protein